MRRAQQGHMTGAGGGGPTVQTTPLRVLYLLRAVPSTFQLTPFAPHLCGSYSCFRPTCPELGVTPQRRIRTDREVWVTGGLGTPGSKLLSPQRGGGLRKPTRWRLRLRSLGGGEGCHILRSYFGVSHNWPLRWGKRGILCCPIKGEGPGGKEELGEFRERGGAGNKSRKLRRDGGR